MAYHHKTATELLSRIVPDEDDAAFPFDEPQFDSQSLEDMYQLMLNAPDAEDDSHDSESDESEPPKPSHPLLPVYNSVIESAANHAEQCSICFCEFDDVVAELACGHHFCVACVAQYLKVTIATAPRLFHKRSFVRSPDGFAISIRQVDLVGVPCPHFNCRGVIETPKIQKIADSETFEKFDRFALDQKLFQLQRAKELVPCPFDCGYFCQEDCLCVNIDCRRKQLVLRSKEKVRLARLLESADTRLENWAIKNPDLVKLCPLGCFSQIEKNGGCDHMYCIKCQKSFLWSQALPFRNQGHWLHKARVELRERKRNPPRGVLPTLDDEPEPEIKQ